MPKINGIEKRYKDLTKEDTDYLFNNFYNENISTPIQRMYYLLDLEFLIKLDKASYEERLDDGCK